MDIINNNFNTEVEYETIPLKSFMCNKTLIASGTLHNVMVHLEKSTMKLLNAIRKCRDELQHDLEFNKKRYIIRSFS